MNLTRLKCFFTKASNRYLQELQKIDNLKFVDGPNRELIEHDVNNLSYYQSIDFYMIMASVMKGLKETPRSKSC